MVGAVPGVTVEPQLSSFPQFQEKIRIGLSAKSDEIDLMACSGSKVREFAKAGWLEPLDDLWDKYRAEYDLDDMPANVVDNMRYEGKLYAVPVRHEHDVLLLPKGPVRGNGSPASHDDGGVRRAGEDVPHPATLRHPARHEDGRERESTS